ncbi:MAG: Uma2 family endonuclease [Gomphosphaeria aponina SAG 52.96 = DSM 107014]|uniref:Uma2 family endonuclease n=1 Tax=Gomphosphaeria aponina SAG 52.96 = DSM 107014 TaxID=1521640 RepID=A0A941GUT5_9CHRO|nr:Uma2 family endonuclease [Gomphosphaeria aponina SAG 52.96 = DSM 107014]
MVTNFSLGKIPETIPENPVKLVTWEEFLINPNERMEWVDGKLVEKTGITFKHSVVQAKLAYYWRNYLNSSLQGGEVCTEALCRTNKQGRRPDVAYITQDLLEEVGNDFTILPQSFPLIAEIASPEDSGEGLFAKAQEYLESGCLEVWLVFPEARLVMVNNSKNWLLFNANEVVTTQNILTGFIVEVKELV